MIKTLIVDDELHAQENLKLLLDRYGNKQFQVVGACSSVATAINSIIQKKPDLVFLDVQMPEKSGIELFDTFTEPDFEVIFTTAHSSYALEAIKVRPYGYLLKPLMIDEFKECLERFVRCFESTAIKQSSDSASDMLVIQSMEQIHFLHKQNIVYLTADGSYTKIYLEHQPPLLVSKHLAQICEKLSPRQFVRVHSKFLVNIRKITYWDKQNHQLFLVTGEKISVSHRKASELQKFLQ